MPNLIKIDEPALLFRHDQAMLDPRDGLSLFGPLDKGKPYGIRWGLVGLADGNARFVRWVSDIQNAVGADLSDVARPPFPGFEAAFGIPWSPTPAVTLVVPADELQKNAFLDDAHQRVFRTVNTFADRIIKACKEEDVRPDVWCVIIPEYVYQNCRPKSYLSPDDVVGVDERMRPSHAQDLQDTPSLFAAENKAAEPYWYELNFHHQLKARLLKYDAPTQVVRESTIAHRDFLNRLGNPIRKLDGLESAIAWHITTAVFYKAGGRPWRLGAARDGVCYVGLVFKNDDKSRDPRTACCAAQMFLDSGDGVVFKGAVGPWYQGKRGLFHLSRRAATDVIRMCVEAYAAKRNGPPQQVFIHGRVRFEIDEWRGFEEGAGAGTEVIGVRIRDDQDLKVYRKLDHPALRGLAYVINDRMGCLWTRGFVPRLRTYPGREVPNPLFIDVCRGRESIEVVLADVLALTKLNYNACQYADGVPVTLKFANAVGEILTAGPLTADVPPLPFKYYI